MTTKEAQEAIERRDINRPLEELHPNEAIKAKSDYLRGTIAESLADPITGALHGDDHQLTKFHGIYQQDDRDLRSERRKQKLEPAYQFMVRLRLPGGVLTPQQWLALDQLAHTHANETLRLTTRQTFQFHGVLKGNLKPTIQKINETLIDTIAACGDDNRNVICNTNPYQSAVHGQVHEWAKRISHHLLPRSHAYHEIWLDQERVAGGEEASEVEPLYGQTYLPRKFKIAIAVPPSNDVDLFTNDLGFIAITEGDKLVGFNVAIGGGMGMTNGEPATYPRLADVIGFCAPEQVLEVAENVVKVQRDYGDRVDRKHARLKYTIDDRGIYWFQNALEERMGWPLEPPRPYHFEDNGDRYGWIKGANNHWHYTQFIENGRVQDTLDYLMMTGLREIAKIHEGEFRVTTNQNLIISNVSEAQKPRIQELLERYGLTDSEKQSRLRRSSMACVAFPTCGLAMAESERYLPSLLTKIETIMQEAGLEEDAIIIRMSGCPNGCSRPYVAEIAFTGRAVGKYNVYLGGGFEGQRLNKLYLNNVDEKTILKELTPIIHHYATERYEGEPFGDFVIRLGYVKEVKAGKEFHD